MLDGPLVQMIKHLIAGNLPFARNIDALIAGGLTPESVSDAVVEVVRTRRFAVLTHPEWSVGVTRRAERIVAGEPPEMLLAPN